MNCDAPRDDRLGSGGTSAFAGVLPTIANQRAERIQGAGPHPSASIGPVAATRLAGLWKRCVASDYWEFLKWSAMAVALFWLLIYHLSQSAGQLPDFVYVNF